MSLADRCRPVDARGERELAWLARCAAERGEPLQCIVSSPALRALDTAQALAEAAGLRAAAVRVDERLYEGSSRRLLDVIAELDDRFTHVAVVGHNPEMADLGRHFSAAITHLPNAGIAALRFDARSWGDAVRGRAADAELIEPLQLSRSSSGGPVSMGPARRARP